MTPPPPRDIVEAVRDELRVPGRYRLHVTVAAAHEPWWMQAWHWVADRFGSLWNAIIAHANVSPAAVNVLGDVLVVLAVAAVAYASARLMITWDRDARRAQAVPLDPVRSAHAAMVAAGEAAARGDYARAIRLAFTAAVTLLDLRGIVSDDKSATVNQLRAVLASRDPRAGEPFMHIARLYTSAAYAEQPADHETWLAARRAYDALVEAIAS